MKKIFFLIKKGLLKPFFVYKSGMKLCAPAYPAYQQAGAGRHPVRTG